MLSAYEVYLFNVSIWINKSSIIWSFRNNYINIKTNFHYFKDKRDMVNIENHNSKNIKIYFISG